MIRFETSGERRGIEIDTESFGGRIFRDLQRGGNGRRVWADANNFGIAAAFAADGRENDGRNHRRGRRLDFRRAIRFLAF